MLLSGLSLNTPRRQQQALRLQRFAKPQDGIGEVAVAINGQREALFSGEPLTPVGAVIDPDVDDLAPAKVVDADANFLFGVFLKLRDKLA